MIEKVVQVELPVGEKLRVLKNRLAPRKSKKGERLKRISVVTGIHGDELEGQYVCYLIEERIRKHPECLKGIVDVYPAMNPLGVDSITRGIPGFDLDMNRIFPGNKDGMMAEYMAAKIIEDVEGSDLAIDIHASNSYLKEIPQVRINEQHQDWLVPIAKYLNMDYIWVHSAATVLESTFAYSLNSMGVNTLVVEMGVGMRITNEYAYQLTEGIFNVMKSMGMWDGPIGEIREPIVSTDGNVHYLNAGVEGVFVPKPMHWKNVGKGELIGEIVNPLTGEAPEPVVSPVNGIVFTLREYPVVYAGSLLARILGQ
ncbi:MAG: succinylglutamate desuccinylase/aspartoacylase family protein [Lachnospiraceae bacterium]|nr:succinylglutamate desuccinylase/aspartoacylase family protein [Lachnospiraceae bacterium]